MRRKLFTLAAGASEVEPVARLPRVARAHAPVRTSADLHSRGGRGFPHRLGEIHGRLVPLGVGNPVASSPPDLGTDRSVFALRLRALRISDAMPRMWA